jgi:glutathione S-transferase
MASIDTSLLPQPTGAAAELAARHAAPHSLRLHGGWFCPFVQRAWIVLVEKDIPHQYVEVNPYKKEGELLALNPRGLVPTLSITARAEDGEKKRAALYESTVICEYLDEAYADEDRYGPRLLPSSSGSSSEREDDDVVLERARCRLWINHIVTKIVPGFYRLLQHTPEKEYSIEEARADFLKGLKDFAQEMLDSSGKKTLGTAAAADGPWFLGSRFSLVDVMLAPWAKRLFLIDHYKAGGVGIPKKGERGKDEEVWARWERWFEAVVNRESVKATWSDDAKYIEAYKRYAEDTTQSQVGQATRQGRSLP